MYYNRNIIFSLLSFSDVSNFFEQKIFYLKEHTVRS